MAEDQQRLDRDNLLTALGDLATHDYAAKDPAPLQFFFRTTSIRL